jgi:glyoxylase-like metal-dependent hydrolase (beta-lactamase superfamily II)
MPSIRHLALAAAFIAAPVLAQTGPVPTGPEMLPFKLGAFEMASLRDADFVAANDGKTFGLGVDPAEVRKVLDAGGARNGRIGLSVSALLVKMPGHVVLLDTGLGTGAKGILIGSLALAKVAPADVTDIFITHSHGDHVGGLVGADGKSVFPKAVIRMSEKEWAFVQSKPANEKLVAAIGAQVKTFVPGADVIPGIRAVALIGHTPGHTGYEIHSGKAKMLDFGDVAHSYIISLAKPEWHIVFDNDQTAGPEMRRATLTRLAASGERVFSPHFPFPGLGRVAKAGTGFVWKASIK